MKKRPYDLRFLLAGIALAAIVFAISLWAWPEWGQDARALLVLGTLALVGAMGFADTIKSLVTPAAETTPQRTIDTAGGPYVEGGVQTGGGDFVGGDKNVTQQGNVNIAGDVHIHPEPPPQATPAPFQIPPPEPTFTGRAEQLEELCRAVETGGAAISGVNGWAGSARPS